MIGSGPGEIADDFAATLQRAVSCVSPAVIVRGRTDPAAPFYLSFNPRLAPLRAGGRLQFSILHTYDLEQRSTSPVSWRVTSKGYWYQLHERGGSEIVAFHWHPDGRQQVPFPHLHVTGQGGSVKIDQKQHVPTGRVSLEAVVRFAIDELQVRPLRADWERILEAGIARFDAQRSW